MVYHTPCDITFFSLLVDVDSSEHRKDKVVDRYKKQLVSKMG